MLGMQLSIVEFARDVLGYEDAHSVELNPQTTHPVIHLMPDQDGIEDIGGTLRLGSYPCVLDKTSKAMHYIKKKLFMRDTDIVMKLIMITDRFSQKME